MSFVPMDLIMVTHHAEWPDTIVTLELARREARLDRRSIPEAMRNCARLRLEKARSPRMRSILTEMTTSHFPETGLRQLKDRLEVMKTKLEKEMRGKLVERADLEELARMAEES